MDSTRQFYSSAQVFPHKGGKWRAQLKYKKNGKWTNTSKVLTATGKRAAQREAEAWRAEMEAKAQFARGIVKKPDTVGEFVSQYVDVLENSQSVERSTLRPYRGACKDIDAGFAGIAYDELDSETAQAWVNRMAADGKAPETIRKALNLLKAAYRSAVERHSLPYSPIEAVKAPKLKKREPNSLDQRGRRKLLEYLDADPLDRVNLAVRIALLTGMRQGEICGMRWRDVDLDEKEIHVRNVLGRDGGKTYQKEPKTGGSRRDVPIPEDIATLLRRRKAVMAEECMAAGVSLSPEYFVLGNVDGSYLGLHHVSTDFHVMAKQLDLIGTEGTLLQFRDLRHVFATAAIASGQDVKSVSSIMGHANAAMTLNRYASADKEAKRRTMDAVSRVMAEEPTQADVVELRPTGTEG